MSIATSTFYVYILARPNGKPFYVGKGKGNRVYEHEQEARTGHKCHKCNVIRKIWRKGGQVQRWIVLETTSEDEALAYEKEMIALHGRPNLTNHTDGGEGSFRPSDSYRKKQSASSKARWRQPEFRKRQSIFKRARWQDPIYRARQSASSKERWTRPGFRENHIAQVKARATNPDWKANQSAKQKALWQDPEYRAEQIARQKAGRDTPEYRAHLSERGKARFESPEQRAAISERSKTRWQDPEYRAKMIAIRNTPEWREKQAAARQRRIDTETAKDQN